MPLMLLVPRLLLIFAMLRRAFSSPYVATIRHATTRRYVDGGAL